MKSKEFPKGRAPSNGAPLAIRFTGWRHDDRATVGHPLNSRRSKRERRKPFRATITRTRFGTRINVSRPFISPRAAFDRVDTDTAARRGRRVSRTRIEHPGIPANYDVSVVSTGHGSETDVHRSALDRVAVSRLFHAFVRAKNFNFYFQLS